MVRITHVHDTDLEARLAGSRPRLRDGTPHPSETRYGPNELLSGADSESRWATGTVRKLRGLERLNESDEVDRSVEVIRHRNEIHQQRDNDQEPEPGGRQELHDGVEEQDDDREHQRPQFLVP